MKVRFICIHLPSIINPCQSTCKAFPILGTCNISLFSLLELQGQCTAFHLSTFSFVQCTNLGGEQMQIIAEVPSRTIPILDHKCKSADQIPSRPALLCISSWQYGWVPPLNVGQKLDPEALATEFNSMSQHVSGPKLAKEALSHSHCKACTPQSLRTVSGRAGGGVLGDASLVLSYKNLLTFLLFYTVWKDP